NWTFSNLEIFGFDTGIVYFAGTNGDAFDGTHIQNNHFQVPVDSSAATDSFQNIAIHYGFGDSQVISGNVIDLTAGTVGGTGGSSSVGIQTSDTFGGATPLMNGLQITNNTVNVTGSATTLGKIRGIWENSAAYGSTITVSGNQYNGFAPTAATDTIAFRV